MEMKFNLIICTYNRRGAIERLLESVTKQISYPDEILVIDSSSNRDTEELLAEREFERLTYFKVEKENSGLTRQRNYGIGKTGKDIDIVCFLDDDIVLEPDYFKNLISTYSQLPDAIAVGGWINDDTHWNPVSKNYTPSFSEFMIDGYVRKLGRRHVLRKKLGLLSRAQPGVMPEFSHGFSTGFLPPSGKIYEVEFFMGGVASYRKELFDKFTVFIIILKVMVFMRIWIFVCGLPIKGNYMLILRPGWRILHEESGRPNHYKYGKMVIENGYYVWKLKYPDLISPLKSGTFL